MSEANENSSKVQARAVIWSALIGSVGMIITAWIGVSFGRNQGVDQRIDLQKELRGRDLTISRQNSEIEQLKARGSLPAQADKRTPIAKPAEVPQFAGSPIATVFKEGVKFDFYGCETNGGSITCALKATSPGQDREFTLAVKQTGGIRRTSIDFTRGVDQNGNEFIASSVTIGNKVNPNSGQLETDLIADVATPVIFEFDGAHPQGDQWSLLELCGASQRPFRVQFHNLPFHV
ncbi:MAG TPA: hypothetical protein VGQ46_05225 [Thermoanaerobaculia bacterium]|jgi:hypothetical protein|nr:hypothetical protein [Thermoanaerobaculia bacterium]